MTQASRLPLEGVKVADFSWFGAGPICGRILADYGATVVRVESETHVDSLRMVAPFAKGKTGYNVSGYFNNYNAGKLGILLNCNTEEGQRIARRLVEWADVFLTNITPRVIERWGLTYENLVQINPEIIAAYVPMQGFDGPHRDFLGFGAVLTPITGYNHLSGFPNRPPMGLGTNYPDYVINPGHTFVAIMAALRYRRRTGKGQRIELAQLESSAAPLGPAIFDYTANGRVEERSGNGLPYAAPHNAFKCKPASDGGRPMDERWVAIACFSDDEWQALVEAMGAPNWATDGEFATLEGRKENETELDARISAWTADKDAYELMEDLQRPGVPAGVVQSAREMLDIDEHMKARGYYVYMEHPEAGVHAHDGPPFVLSKTPGSIRSPAPCLGEHTEYVCKEILGLDDEGIAELMVAGALA
ncbi:MAG TPA: CoA transferase [Dehalococcoidia bacterium]|nr:CoA transferase [Dehalococcoidia bacterium]